MLCFIFSLLEYIFLQKSRRSVVQISAHKNYLIFFKGRVHISVYGNICWMVECTDLSDMVHRILKENGLQWVCLKTKGFLSVASIKLQKAILALFRNSKGQYSISCQWWKNRYIISCLIFIRKSILWMYYGFVLWLIIKGSININLHQHWHCLLSQDYKQTHQSFHAVNL